MQDAVGAKANSNVQPAVALDASQPWDSWAKEVRAMEGQAALVFASNVTHISPWETSQGILSGSVRPATTGLPCSTLAGRFCCSYHESLCRLNSVRNVSTVKLQRFQPSSY